MPTRSLSLYTGSVVAFCLGLLLALAGDRLLAGEPPSARGPEPDFDAVRRTVVISRDELPDAAIAVFDSVTPRIYLNTRLLSQIGPDLAAFLRAHEEGHVAYHHVPERRFGLVRLETPAPVLHAWEFAADCYAGQVLRRRRPAAVLAAITFFQNRRDLVTDSAHPPMGARADRLIDCLTDPDRAFRNLHR